ncbi:MAG: DNA-binding ferritin-like protein [Lentimonas sp.]|jgi:DNA-binding ferritin-like protein
MDVGDTDFAALHQALRCLFPERFAGIESMAERIRELGALAPREGGGIWRSGSWHGRNRSSAQAHKMVLHLSAADKGRSRRWWLRARVRPLRGGAEPPALMIARI